MARYRRNAMGWMSQPRDMNGRFASSGSGDNEFIEWLFRQRWWLIALILAGFTAFVIWLYYSGYILAFIIGAFILSLILPLLVEPLAMIIAVIMNVWRWAKMRRQDCNDENDGGKIIVNSK